MSNMLSVRGRIVALAAILLLLLLSISGTAWHALTRTSDTLLESVRAGNYLGYIIVSMRELSGADRRIINYIQTGRRDDEQRYAKRKADAEGAFTKAIDLVQDDPVRRQAMLNIQQDVHDFFAEAETLIRERRSLGQRASAIRDGLAALAATSASDATLDTYVAALQRDAQTTLLAVLDPSDSQERSFANLPDAAGPATSGALAPPFAGAGRSAGAGDVATMQSIGIVQRNFTGAAAPQTASNSAAGIDTRLLLVSKKAEEIARTLPMGNPAADGVTQILIATALALIGGVLLTGLTMRRVGGPLTAISVAAAGLARGDGAVEIPDLNGTDELGALARALAILKQNAGRMASVATSMSRVASGDRAVDIPELHSADGIGAMARTVRAMQQKFDGSQDESATNATVCSMAAVVSRAAEGDLAVRVAVDRAGGPLSELGGQINLLLDASGATATQLTEYVRGVARALADTRAAAERVSRVSGTQSDAAANLASALARQENALRSICATLAGAQVKAGSLSQLGEESLVAVDRLAVVVDEIVRTSTNINEISHDIAEIAGRTQFLCLNASIEAARVGDHGKGFAAVAQEVGKLAENASQNSRQLAALAERGTSALAEGKSSTALMCGTIRNLIEESRRTAEIIDASAAAVGEQRAEMAGIGSQMSGLLETATLGADAAKEIVAGIDRLEPSADAARSRIANFRLDDRQGARTTGA